LQGSITHELRGLSESNAVVIMCPDSENREVNELHGRDTAFHAVLP
jgi:hypothetical protein